jgi:hypothetical protein
LVCEFWDGNISQDFNSYQQEDIHLQVIDQGHAGGALVAATVLPGSAWGRSATPPPSLWSASNIQWYDDANGGHWEFQLQFANVDQNSRIIISPNPNQGSNSPPPTSCNGTGICTWKIQITPEDISRWFDHMDLSIQGDQDDLWHLLNIRSQISPHVTVMSADFSSWSGNNFTQVFSSAKDSTKKTGLMIGATLIPIDCPVPNSCVVSDPTKLSGASGVMYLAALNQKFPLLQLNSDGTTQPITFQPPKNNNGAAQTNQTNLSPNTPPGAVTQPVNTVVIGGSSK